MEEREMISVNLQLPASALDSLSRLAEQLRKLTAAAHGWTQAVGAPEEAVESGFFDPERFLALRQTSKAAARPDLPEEVPAARGEITESIPQPEQAWQALPEMKSTPEREEQALVDRSPGSDPESGKGSGDSGGLAAVAEEIPTARPSPAWQALDAPAASAELDIQVPEAEAGSAHMGEGDVTLPAVRMEISGMTEMPLGADAAMTARPDPGAGRWAGVAEELAGAGPAPLTAEAVSLAFQRDGRRYDNGFPLY